MSETQNIAQSIAIPYRVTSTGTPEFCMITSNKKGDWIFPKGNIEPGESPEEAAIKEALEEAGLHGELDPEPIGTFTRKKWGMKVPIYVFLMNVTKADETWHEAHKRRRCWRAPEKAISKLGKPYLLPYLGIAIERVKRHLETSLQAAFSEEGS